jgi:hypothetical protein
MPLKIAISLGWAISWLKANLTPYLKDYADDPQELKNRAGQLIEDEVKKIYSGINYPEKQDILNSLKYLYESLGSTSEDDWGKILSDLYPSIEQEIAHKPSFEDIMEAIEPKRQLSLEDVEQEEQIAPPSPTIKPESKRPIENVMILHPKTRQPFSVGIGTKVYNSDKKSVGTIEEIYEDRVVVEEEKSGQLTNWPLTDQIWESFK